MRRGAPVTGVPVAVYRALKLHGARSVSWYGMGANRRTLEQADMGLFNLHGRAAMLLAPLIGLSAGLPAPSDAGQIDSSAYFHLRRGMSESEVLVRAGPPDLVTSPGLEAVEIKHGMVERGDDGAVSFDTFRRTRIPTIARWHYIPGAGETDPFITIITFRGGEIWEIERTKVFSRYRPKSPASASEGDAGKVTDTDIQRERADNTLKAAEAYAATRARLKKEAAEGGVDSASGETTPIYTGVRPDGSTYFGDAPAGDFPE